jgi:hypothetical protein
MNKLQTGRPAADTRCLFHLRGEMLMKSRFFILALTVLANACGSSSSFVRDDSPYAVEQRLGIDGAVVLSYTHAYLYRAIAIDGSQAATCATYARDYGARAGVKLIQESLELTYDAPGRHCARRNAFKQCETYQYIYTFHCQYRVEN